MTGDDDFLAVPEDAKIKEDRQRKELEFSQLYVAAFVHNPAGAALLAHWTQVYAKKRTPVNAPHTEYAANEALRAFVEGVQEQIRFAQTRAV